MKKRKINSIISVVLCLIITITILQPVVFAKTEYTYNSLTYTISNDTIIITGCDKSVMSVNIPSQIDGLDVTTIGNNAFYECSSLENIVIPSGVSSIGEFAFYNCVSLADVTLSKGVSSIGRYAFYNCGSLTDITIPSGVTDIEDYTFRNCGALKNITLPKGIISIETDAFYNCAELSDVYYSGSQSQWDAVSIGSYNDNLKNATMHYNTEITYENVLDKTLSGTCGDDIAWEFNTSTGKLVLSGEGAMTNYGGTSAPWLKYQGFIKNIEIGNGITSISPYAFYHCGALESISIPNTVLSIGNNAFYECSSIESIVIPSGVSSIGEFAFYNCVSLADVTLSKGVSSIGRYAFYNCGSLTDITIPSGVTDIESYTFASCDALKTATMYKSVLSIDTDAFYNCSRLTDVYYEGNESEWSSISIGSYNDCLKNAIIHYNFKIIDDALTDANRSISIKFTGGQDIVYNADSNSYSIDSFTLIGTVENLWQLDDWDRENYSANNVKVELTLPNGFSFEQNSNVQSKTYLFEEIIYTDNISDTIYLSNPPTGKSQMSVKISGDNIEETNTTYEFNIDKYEFQIDIYRAKHLTNSETGSIMEDTYIDITSTPCKILYDAGQENGLDNAIAAWDAVMNSLDIVDNPASIADYAFEEKDMYEAIIMNLFESSVDYKIMGYINGEITKQSKNLFSQITSQMKNKYNFDLLYGTNLKKLTDKQRQEVADDMAEYFKNDYQNAAIVSKGVGFISDALKYANDFQSLCEKVSAYYNIMCLSDSMKQVMQDMYNECPADKLALKQALKDCINIMNSGDDEFTQKMLVNLMGLTGKNVAQAGINEYWNSVKTTFSVAHPAAFAFQAAYSAGKYLTQVWCNADAIAEKYCNIVALMNVETLLDSIYTKTKTNFQHSSTQGNAKLYNSIVDVMFNMVDTDCKYAIAYVDAIDSSLAGKLAVAFGDSSTEELKKSVKSIQSSSSLFYVQVLTDWITQLYEDDINKYYDYEHLIDESYENYRKKYNINCPVDVYVFDKNGVIVGSVVNNVPYCREDANITISVIDDRKTLYMYGDEYDIVYKGNDTGTMDITVTEYDETNSAARNVYFNNLELTEGLTYTSSETGTNSTENVYTLSNEAAESIAPDFDTVTDAESETYTAQISRGYFADTMAISQELHRGENVDITAYVPEGYKFVNWTSDAECDVFDNANNITTKITMPDYDVNITANLVSVPTLSISSITENSVAVKANGCESISEGKIILAIYKENGTLEQLKMENYTDEFTFTDLKLTKGKVKVMLWSNLNNLIPLTEATKKIFYFATSETE